MNKRKNHVVGMSTQGAGFTMLEVLIALFVLSIGLLGLAALQATSLALNTDSYLRTQATFFAYDILDRMRANPTGLNAGAYDVTTSGDAATKASSSVTCDGDGNACDSSNLALGDLGDWYRRMDLVLPGAQGNRATITRVGTFVTIIITWTEHDILMRHAWEAQL